MKHGTFTWATTAEALSSAAVTASSTDWTMTMMGMPASLIFLMGSLSKRDPLGVASSLTTKIWPRCQTTTDCLSIRAATDDVIRVAC